MGGATEAELSQNRPANEGDALDLLRALIAAQRDGEAAVQAVVTEFLQRSGCAVETRPYDPAEVPVVGEFATGRTQASGMRENVVARLAGDAALNSILMFAHPDSEPVADTDGWTVDPFAGEIVDGRLHGWGVADDLAGVAAGAAALARAARTGAALGDVILVSTPSKRHARGVAAVLHQGLVADGALYLHPAESGAGLNEVKAFAAGQLEFRITVSGRLPDTTEPGHTGFAHLAINPIEKAMLVASALREVDASRAARIHHPMLEAAVGRSTNLMISTIQCGQDARYGRLNEVCVMGGAVSFPPGETHDEVKAEIERALAAVADGDPWLAENPPKIDWVAGVTGAECPPDHPLYRSAERAILAVTGAKPRVNPMHTASDIRNPIVQKGIPTVGIGGLGGDLSQNGKHDEWVDVADFLRTVEATAAMIVDWCGTPREGQP